MVEPTGCGAPLKQDTQIWAQEENVSGWREYTLTNAAYKHCGTRIALWFVVCERCAKRAGVTW